MRIIKKECSVAIMIAVAMFIMPCRIAVADAYYSGVVGTMMSVGRLKDKVCGRDSEGCEYAYNAVRNTLNKFYILLDRFDCVPAVRKPKITMSSELVPFSKYDSGRVVVITESNVICGTDPRFQFKLVDFDKYKEACSTLEYKCDAIWFPDYDRTEAFVGSVVIDSINP